MEKIFNGFEPELTDLSPEVKAKALEIAEKLMKEKNMPKSEAIKLGIYQAEEWFFDLEG
ncbi:MAG: hypothetical protein H7098_02420 [Oligoflexus sp.]|nr:hypothetical protein [Pseudopedobacter sp.]